MLVGLKALPRRWRFYLAGIVAALLLSAVVCALAVAEVQRATVAQCTNVGAIAAAARAMALENVEAEKAAGVIGRLFIPQNDDTVKVMVLIIAVAYTTSLSVPDYAAKVAEKCLLGDPDPKPPAPIIKG